MTPDNSNYHGTLTTDELIVLENYASACGTTVQGLMMCMGGTGFGMTFNPLIPLAQTLLGMTAAERSKLNDKVCENPFDLSIYLTDGMAVLYHDLKVIARRKDLAGKLVQRNS